MGDQFPLRGDLAASFASDIARKRRGMRIVRTYRTRGGSRPECFYGDNFDGSGLSSYWTSGGAISVSGGALTLGPSGAPSFANNSILNVSAETDIDWVAEVRFGQNGDQYFAVDAPSHLDGARWERSGSDLSAIKLVNGASSVVATVAAFPNLTTVRLRIQTIGSTVNWYKQVVDTESNWVLMGTASFTWDGNGKMFRLGVNDVVSTMIVNRIYQETKIIVCP